jgi:hypothetical protein
LQKAIKGAGEATVDPTIDCGILFATGRIKLNGLLNRIHRIVENFTFNYLNEPFFQFEPPLFTVRVSGWKESSNKPFSLYGKGLSGRGMVRIEGKFGLVEVEFVRGDCNH